MLDKENDVENIDPPDNQGGGNLEESDAETAPIDPPDNQGGGN